ncbi:alpha/beta hydrolase [Nocardia sp. NPDC051030]|uniref:alpha/beta fold hydrolase n=1 Tax=Nocardia sp. NPDC051030 TaxID=3155162 RepID=UPI00342E4088
MIVTLTALAVAAPVAGAFGHRQLRRKAAAEQLRITTPNGIDESGFVRIGGIDQWIQIRGEDLRNPVLLEIHGGPGASNLPFTTRTRDWERHFTVVRWDMRGAGKTFGHTGADAQGEMSLARMELDALEVTQHVRSRLGVDQVLLVANSFGSMIGLRLARSHPELYSAYVGTDQNISAGGANHAAYDALVRRLEQQDKRKQLAVLADLGRERSAWTAEQLMRFNKLVFNTDPLTVNTLKTVVLHDMWFSPLHTLRELRAGFQGQTFSEQLGPQAVSIDERAEGTDFRIPVFFFQGDSDVMTPPEPARRFLTEVTAPVKDFALIEEASHFASFRHPERFLDLLLTEVRPVITGARSVR